MTQAVGEKSGALAHTCVFTHAGSLFLVDTALFPQDKNKCAAAVLSFQQTVEPRGSAASHLVINCDIKKKDRNMALPLFHICPASKTVWNNKNKVCLLVQMCTQSLTLHCMAFISCTIFRMFQYKNVNICGIALIRAAWWDAYCYFKTMQDFTAALG